MGVSTCLSCGAAVDATFRFCPVCGASLHLQTDVGGEERRLVSILFADLVGFTARSERLDPEDVLAVLRPYHSRLRSEIEAFGGTVEKFIGDAVVGIFGAPVSHGDDPERAVRAALAITGAIGEMNAADTTLDLSVRVAVNTGEVVVATGARVAEGEGLVTGDVVNTASRLQLAAPVNGVLVGDETYRTTRSAFEYSQVPPIAVRGKAQPVGAWQAVRALTAPGARGLRHAPLFGRESELAALRGIWHRVAADSVVHLTAIFGEAGIGKSRLAADFLDGVEREGAGVYRGRAVPYGATTLYGPFAQHVKQVAQVFASDSAAVARQKLQSSTAGLDLGDPDHVAACVALLVGIASNGGVSDRQVLFEAAREWVQAVAGRGPTVLVFEDLHWADAGTLDLLELLATRIRGSPLLLLALARPELLETRSHWQTATASYTPLHLEPLDSGMAGDLASWLMTSVRALEQASDTSVIVDAAQGNPLFIEEFATSLAERSTTRSGSLPTTVRDVIAARLDALPTEERSLVLDAAVVGRTFWRGALEQLHLQQDVDKALRSLEARAIVVREPLSWIENDEQYSFKHVLIREVAHATISRRKRRERHAAVAAFLEARTRGGGATATALAEHWREGGDAGKAVRYLLLAADQASRGWAKDEAADLYKEALELLGEGDVERRRQIAKLRAVAMQAAYHVTDARLLAERPGSEAPEIG